MRSHESVILVLGGHEGIRPGRGGGDIGADSAETGLRGGSVLDLGVGRGRED